MNDRPAAAPPPLDPVLAEVAEALSSGGSGVRGFEAAEVYAKSGRSRRLAIGADGRSAGFHHERGWAVRASSERASLFAAGSGEPRADHPWPEPDGKPLALPAPDAAGAAEPWSEPADLDAPLIGETEGLRLLAALAEALAGELPRARLTAAVLEDGSSESQLLSLRGRHADERLPGVRGRWRRRAAVLHAEAALGPVRAAIDLAEREARAFTPAALARRLADRLAACGAGVPAGFTGRDRGAFLLAPPLAARLLAALVPLFVGPGAAERAAALADRRGRWASPAVTVVDDGRHPGGLLAAPCDGEGLPTRRVVLVEAGGYRQALVPWWEARAKKAIGKPSGCAQRPGWRDPPRPGVSHLHLAPDAALAASALLADLARGYYLLEATGAPVVDWQAGAFRVPVCGFAVERGQAKGAVSEVWLCGSVGALLRGVQAVGRDLAFFPFDGMVGAPTVLVTGVELRG